MLPKYIMRAIVKHAAAAAPDESCGLVIRVGRRYKYVPCQNAYNDPTGATTTQDAFTISDLDWIAAEDQGEVVRVIHSHPGQGDDPQPSIGDVESCNRAPYVWGIVTDTGGYIEITPADKPLRDRRFVLGVTDCYGLVMDWHAKQGVTLPDFRVPYAWWEKGENLFMDNWHAAGFRVCEPNTPGAMVVMQVGANVPNHCGVYLPDNRLLHHMYGQLSCTIPFSMGYYRDNVVLWVRHKDLPETITTWL